jgi:hypothetical protein
MEEQGNELFWVQRTRLFQRTQNPDDGVLASADHNDFIDPDRRTSASSGIGGDSLP